MKIDLGLIQTSASTIVSSFKMEIAKDGKATTDVKVKKLGGLFNCDEYEQEFKSKKQLATGKGGRPKNQSQPDEDAEERKREADRQRQAANRNQVCWLLYVYVLKRDSSD